MANDIIERAARAIAEYHDEDPDQIDPLSRSMTGKDLARWRKYAPLAGAVLQAIRVPNKAMVNAALHWQDHCSDVDSLFEQMIAAALHGESLPPHPDLKLYSSDATAEETAATAV